MDTLEVRSKGKGTNLERSLSEPSSPDRYLPTTGVDGAYGSFVSHLFHRSPVPSTLLCVLHVHSRLTNEQTIGKPVSTVRERDQTTHSKVKKAR